MFHQIMILCEGFAWLSHLPIHTFSISIFTLAKDPLLFACKQLTGKLDGKPAGFYCLFHIYATESETSMSMHSLFIYQFWEHSKFSRISCWMNLPEILQRRGLLLYLHSTICSIIHWAHRLIQVAGNRWSNYKWLKEHVSPHIGSLQVELIQGW